MEKHCSVCGYLLFSDSVVCNRCGTEVKKDQVHNSDGKGVFLWGLLGFFVPFMGLFLFVMLKKSKPRIAKSLGIGSLIYILLCCIMTVFQTSIVNEIKEDYYDEYYEDYKFE